MSPIVENPFTWVYFPTALALGALHALEPGHAKTLTAAYLIGLAVTLVGIGLAVVAGLSRLHDTGKFHWVSGKAPIMSAAVVILSGLAALLFAH